MFIMQRMHQHLTLDECIERAYRSSDGLKLYACSFHKKNCYFSNIDKLCERALFISSDAVNMDKIIKDKSLG